MNWMYQVPFFEPQESFNCFNARCGIPFRCGCTQCCSCRYGFAYEPYPEMDMTDISEEWRQLLIKSQKARTKQEEAEERSKQSMTQLREEVEEKKKRPPTPPVPAEFQTSASSASGRTSGPSSGGEGSNKIKKDTSSGGHASSAPQPPSSSSGPAGAASSPLSFTPNISDSKASEWLDSVNPERIVLFCAYCAEITDRSSIAEVPGKVPSCS